MRLERFFKVVEKTPQKSCSVGLSSSPKDKIESVFSTTFTMKKDMYMAPTTRRPKFSADEKAVFDDHIFKQEIRSEKLYLNEIKTGTRDTLARCRSRKTLRILRSIQCNIVISDQMDVVEIKDSCDENSVHQITDQESEVSTEAKKQFLAAKLFQFNENLRPPYYGTWRKRCLRLNGRAPFRRAYEKFDYDVDSEAEWEEEDADADECKSNEDETDANDEGEEEDDGFIVEHGYLSESEEEQGQDDIENDSHLDPETRRVNMKIKAEAWKSEKLCRKWDKLKSMCIIHPKFTAPSNSVDSHIVELFKSMEAVIVDPSLTNLEQQRPSSSDKSASTKSVKRKKKTKETPVISKRNLMDIYCTSPATKIPKIDEIRLIHSDKHNARRTPTDNGNQMTKILPKEVSNTELRNNLSEKTIVDVKDEDSIVFLDSNGFS